MVAARNALGIAAPLAAGTLAGNAALGLATTIGALQTGFADRPGPYRLRALRMLGTAFAVALTSGLAVLASRSDTGAVLLLLVLSFVAGLMLVGGPSATQVGVAGVAAALVIGHTPQPPSVALHVGLLVLLGGAIQTVLAISAWPLRRHRPERVALAGLYRELAGAARAQLGSEAGLPAGTTLLAVRRTLYGLGHDHGPSVEAYRVLLDEAERIRREIVIVVGITRRLEKDDQRTLAAQLRGSLTAAASVLDELAEALEQARPVRAHVLDTARVTLDCAVDALRAEPGLTQYAAVGRLRALSGQLRAAVDGTRAGASEGRAAAGGDEPITRPLQDAVATLRANLNPNSAVLRHALRLSILLAGSDLVVRLAGITRGYWLPLTLLVVLRPDFGTTFQRAVLRVIGTIVGLLIATALVHWVPGGDWWRVVLILLLAFGMRLAGPGNVGLSAVCLSGLVVVLLAINGVPAHSSVDSRALATLAGGGLAVLASLALPAWERSYVPVRLAGLLDAYREYLRVVADPAADRTALQAARAACRLARSNAQASVDRARSEPVRGQSQVELGSTVLAQSHRFVRAMFSVEAVRRDLREAGGVAELSRFLASAGDALDAAHDALLADEPPGPVPSLRPGQQEVAELLLGDTGPLGLETATTLVEATDRIANSLDTLVEELRRQLPLPARETAKGLLQK